MQLIPIRKKFRYPKLQRVDSPDGRRYVLDEVAKGLPSVTTILSATKDQTFLKEWEERVGKEEAERIRNEAATVGTHMHSVVERLLLNRPLDPPRTWLQVKGYRMGYTLIEKFFEEVQEVWGAEVPLYYPDRYAGTTDCIAVYKGAPSIIDFKQTNRMKRRDWIDDYFIQLAAYAMAHNKVHGTEIMHGVILMVAQNGEVQEFVTCGREFLQYQDEWMKRVSAYEKGESAKSQTTDSQSPPTSEGEDADELVGGKGVT